MLVLRVLPRSTNRLFPAFESALIRVYLRFDAFGKSACSGLAEEEVGLAGGGMGGGFGGGDASAGGVGGDGEGWRGGGVGRREGAGVGGEAGKVVLAGFGHAVGFGEEDFHLADAFGEEGLLVHDLAVDGGHGAVVGAVDVAGEGAGDGGFDVGPPLTLLPVGTNDDGDAGFAVGEEAPARGEFLSLDHAGGGEDVVEIGHGLGEAGFELAETDTLAEGAAVSAALFAAVVSGALHEGEFELAVFGDVAEEIGAGGFALDEASLVERLGNEQIVVIGAEESRADGVDDAEGRETDFSCDAAVAHSIKPTARLFLEELMKICFASHDRQSLP